ncbi:MAG: hypothetical protein ABR557_14890, partial [Pyrinomonadaceae bacterium]
VRFDAYGPTGLRKMTQEFFNYQKFDIDTRIVDEGRPDPRKLVTTHEFYSSGLVLRNADVKVSSLRVRHPPIKQSYAYRFDAKDRSVVISGDTAYVPELAAFASGADVLIHEGGGRSKKLPWAYYRREGSDGDLKNLSICHFSFVIGGFTSFVIGFQLRAREVSTTTR